MAFVVLHPRHASQWGGRHDEFANDLKEHAKSRLPGFSRPEWIEVVSELPVSDQWLCIMESVHSGDFGDRKLARARS